MDASLKLGRMWGIPIGVHYSWFFVFGLVTWSFAIGFLPEDEPGLATWVYWLLGLLTSILLFGSVLVHELAHALVARRHQVPVHGINLFIFGGVAQFTEEPRTPRAAFRIAAAGPLASFVLAGLFAIPWLFDIYLPYLSGLLYELARINLVLALFNLIPGFPLDGGQILRAAVWGWTGNLHRATKFAAITGQVAAFGFIGLGIFVMVTASFFSGLWLIFIGWFLQNAAAASYSHSQFQQSLEGIKVAQAMSRNLPNISGLQPLSTLVSEQVLGGGQRYFFVNDNGRLEGMVSLNDVIAIPQRKWGFMTARQVMIPLDRLVAIDSEVDLGEALKMMEEINASQILVKQNDNVVGLLSQQDVLRFVNLRSELGV